jgi:antirestriction protein
MNNDTPELKIFIGKASAPASGAWFTLPFASDEEISEAIEECGEGGEYLISDYEGFPGRLEEGASIQELSDFAEWLEDESPSWGVVMAIWDSVDEVRLDEIQRIYKNGSYSYFFTDDDSDEGLGYAIIKELYGENIPDDLRVQYFDEEQARYDLGLDYDDEDEIEELIEEMLDDPGLMGNNDYYFDYESFGRDVRINDDYTYYEDGWVCVYY